MTFLNKDMSVVTNLSDSSYLYALRVKLNRNPSVLNIAYVEGTVSEKILPPELILD